jgi:fido (protein-threonine AMPylation protein)
MTKKKDEKEQEREQVIADEKEAEKVYQKELKEEASRELTDAEKALEEARAAAIRLEDETRHRSLP